MKRCSDKNIEVVCFADCHTEKSPELISFPPHCMKGSGEEKVDRLLKNICEYTLIEKNSTNGFIEPTFQRLLEEKSKICNFIVVGDCTDICIMQFAVTAKAWYNTHGIKSRVIVPFEYCETYSSQGHDGDVLGAAALALMAQGGVEICSGVN